MKPNVILGITGSIAAYKAAELASQLTKRGCNVTAVMTADAQEFITPLTIQVLTQNPVVTGLYDEKQSWHDKIAGTTIVRVPKGTPLL